MRWSRAANPRLSEPSVEGSSCQCRLQQEQSRCDPGRGRMPLVILALLLVFGVLSTIWTLLSGLESQS